MFKDAIQNKYLQKSCCRDYLILELAREQKLLLWNCQESNHNRKKICALVCKELPVLFCAPRIDTKTALSHKGARNTGNSRQIDYYLLS
jgi:hypothetical protein